MWDTIGAQAAGMQGALLTRPHNAVLPAENVPTPDFIAAELMTLADQLIAAREALSELRPLSSLYKLSIQTLYPNSVSQLCL